MGWFRRCKHERFNIELPPGGGVSRLSCAECGEVLPLDYFEKQNGTGAQQTSDFATTTTSETPALSQTPDSNASPIRVPRGYFEAELPSPGHERCRNPRCPCSQSMISRGSGCLWIPPEVVVGRQNLRSMDEVRAALEIANVNAELEKLRGVEAMAFGLVGAALPSSATKPLSTTEIPRHVLPVLLCEAGAKARGLQLDVAEADARHWWQTGFIPLRPTPSTEYARIKRITRWPALGLYLCAILIVVLIIVGIALITYREGTPLAACALTPLVFAGLMIAAGGRCLASLSTKVVVYGACVLLGISQIGLPLAVWVIVILRREDVSNAFDSPDGVPLNLKARESNPTAYPPPQTEEPKPPSPPPPAESKIDEAPIISQENADDARARSARYRKALEYLNSCGEMSFEKYREAYRIADFGMTDWEVRGLWEASIDAIVATHDTDYARTHLKQELTKGIGLFDRIAAKGPPPSDSTRPAAPPPTDLPRPAAPSAAIPAMNEGKDPTSSFSFTCPNCARRVTAPRLAAGKTGKCPGCQQKVKIPAADASPSAKQEASATASTTDLPLVEREAGNYESRLIQTNDPASRLRLGISLCDIFARDGNKEAVKAVLTSLTCDDRGEVSIGLACALAQLTGPYAKAVKDLILKTYGTTGDSTFFGGKPLLRLAYVPALQRDLARLKELAILRIEDNGTDLVRELAGFLENKKTYGVYRVIAWGEGLDGAFNPAILDAIPEDIMGKSALIAGLTEAAAYIKRHDDFH